MMALRAASAAVLLLFAADWLRGEPFPPEMISREGTEIFRALLRNQGLEPVNPMIDEFNPSRTVLIILGPIGDLHNPHMAQLSRNFIAEGGAVLIATNREAILAPYLPSAPRLHITGQPVMDEGPDANYEGKAEYPLMQFPLREMTFDADFIAFAQLKRVAARRASFLAFDRDDPSVHPMGFYSPTARPTGPDAEPLTSMAIYQYHAGSAVILADAEMLNNERLLPPKGSAETDNCTFAWHLAAWLSQSQNRTTRRTHCLFYENGIPSYDFDRVQLATGPPEFRPSWPAIQKIFADNADRKIAELQGRDSPTRDLLRAAEYPLIVQRLAAALAFFASVLLLRAVLANQHRNRKPSELSMATSTVQTMLKTDNLHLAARERIRLQLYDWCGSHPESPPVLDVRGGFFYRKRMAHQVKVLWRIAFRDAPTRVTAKRWREHDARIAAIQGAIQSGDIRFRNAEAPA